jgi:methyltransferase
MSGYFQLFLGVIGAVALERLGELALSLRNLRWARERGGVEAGRGHYPWMVALHTALLAAAPLEVWYFHRRWIPSLGWTMLALVMATMALRYWAIAALGRRWNTRVVIVPGEPPVLGGPYRFLRHPNYLAVVLEIAALPLIHAAWLTALLFSLANAWILRVRIAAEEKALNAASDYESAFAGRPRLLPRLR